MIVIRKLYHPHVAQPPLLGCNSINNMALKTVDLTQQPERAVFTGCSQEEVNYAKTFWQSIQLLPPMESRLVSSDIKQRLRRAPPSRSMSESLELETSAESFTIPSSSTVTLSNSSSRIEDSINLHKLRLSSPSRLERSREDSLKTQTSLAPEFSSIYNSGEQTSSGKEYIHKASVQFSWIEEITDERRQPTVPPAEGWGLRWFWPWGRSEGKEKHSPDQSAKSVTAHSDQMKDFLKWAEHAEMLRLAEGMEVLECGGEDLCKGRGKNRHVPSCIQMEANKAQAGDHGQKKGALFTKTKGGQHLEAKRLGRAAPYRQDKKSQHTVRTKTPGRDYAAETASLFHNQRISFGQGMQHEGKINSKETASLQPATNALLPEKFAKHPVPSQKDSTLKQEKLADNTKAANQGLKSSYDYDQNKEKTASDAGSPGTKPTSLRKDLTLKQEKLASKPKVTNQRLRASYDYDRNKETVLSDAKEENPAVGTFMLPQKSSTLKQGKVENKPKATNQRLGSRYDYDRNKERTISNAMEDNSVIGFTPKQEKLVNKTEAANQALTSHYDYDQNKERTANDAAGENRTMKGGTRIADKPAMHHRPSKDIVYWPL